MKPTSVANPFASKGVFLGPSPISKQNRSSGYELHPSLKAMVQALPYHLREFEEMCSCLTISGMTQETLRWALFPFSLIEKAKQWYTHAVGSTNRDWDELKDKFCLPFFPMSYIGSLPRVVLDLK
jgi:hypothetical protein